MPTSSHPPSAGPPAAAEIERLLDELSRTARGDLTREAFFVELLDRTIAATGAAAGIVWTETPDGRYQPEFYRHAELFDLARDRGIQTLHEQTLGQLARSTETAWISPGLVRSPSAGGARSGDQLLSFTPLRDAARLRGVLELAHRPTDDPATRRGLASVLDAFAELAAEFLQRWDWRTACERERFWRQCEQFTARIHTGLALHETATEIANEARRLLEVDRVSVVAWRGTRARVEAVSGLERVDRRTDVVRGLERLAEAAFAAREPVWYGTGRGELPPQIVEPLERYLEQAPARILVVHPLAAGAESATSGRDSQSEFAGALVVEKFSGQPPADFPERLAVLARQSASALANSAEYSTLPLVGLMRLARDLSWIGSFRRWPWLLRAAAIATVAGAVAALAPAEHSIEVRGVLQPRSTRDVFAPVDGDVSDVAVRHEQDVARDELLVALRSPTLELERRRVTGERDATRERLQAVESSRLAGGDPDSSPRGADRLAAALSGSAEELRKQLESHDRQLAILDEQDAALRVRSPIAGTVLTWKVEETLTGRPVQRGQVLVTVGDVEGPWELRLEIPDRRVGHVLDARRRSGPDLPVRFLLAAAPDREYSGRIREIWQVVEPASTGGGSVVRVLVDFERDQLQALRPGATVVAKIDCGRRSLGYVWFHGLYETAQRALFW